jgi:uncharacterized protein involved in exopolysaccharide biosynthesis
VLTSRDSGLSVEARSERDRAVAPAAIADPRPGRLRIRLGLGDILLQFWRAKFLMLLVFMPIALLGLAVALVAPVTYAASARLLVRPGADYLVDPLPGEAVRGALPPQEAMMRAEAELARSPAIALRVIRQVGLGRLYPALAERAAHTPPDRRYPIEQAALSAFARDLDIAVTPGSAILKVTFAHANPELAAETVNAFTTLYATYRLDVLTGRGAEGFAEQRRVIEDRLAAADAAVRSYLTRNALSDFDAEQAAVTRLYGDVADQQAEVETALREAEGKVQGLRRQMATTPREIALYTEATPEQELTNLRLERDKLLVRYKPDSLAVQDIDKQIAQMAAYVKATPAGGLKRMGPNPTWQTLEADAATAQASIDALAARQAELVRQKAETDARRMRLAMLEPDYRRLVRERDALEASAGAFAAREQTERARAEMATREAGAVSVYEQARPPTTAVSPKRAIVAAAALVGVVAALAAALLRMWSVGGFATAGSLERTLGLRVLATVRERA